MVNGVLSKVVINLLIDNYIKLKIIKNDLTNEMSMIQRNINRDRVPFIMQIG
jgi:hypothetical protein